MKQLEGKLVRIWWTDPACTWHHYTVLRAWPRLGFLLLLPAPNANGDICEGEAEFWVNIEEVAMLQEVSRSVH